MPSFCRHNRFVENCPICKSPEPEKPARKPRTASSGARTRSTGTGVAKARRGDVRVRQMTQAASDGYEHDLIPGVKATADARRLAEEVAFSVARLEQLQSDPPGLYADVASGADPEEARWLAFLIAYIGPAAEGDAFAAIRDAAVPWATGELPELAGVELGPRTAHEESKGTATLAAYRTWAERAGSQQDALLGEPSWTPERRFDRLSERLALPGFGRDARYELLVTLARLGVVEAQPTSLRLGGDDAVTLAAKRVFGIGDTMLLERRARDLAEHLAVPIEALDQALFNWGRHPKPRATQGAAGLDVAGEADALAGELDA